MAILSVLLSEFPLAIPTVLQLGLLWVHKTVYRMVHTTG